MTTPFRRIAVATAVWVGCTTAAVHAGDLNPPAGPISPTMKNFAEVEPRTPINATTTPGDADSLYKITQSGSCYLAGNVQGVAVKMGIEVVAGYVTIDLRGFALVGAGGAAGAKVSWQVQAVRNDAYVRLRGAPVVAEKDAVERGTYQHPELYGQPAEKGLNKTVTPPAVPKRTIQQPVPCGQLGSRQVDEPSAD